jgi:hypothetical protein
MSEAVPTIRTLAGLAGDWHGQGVRLVLATPAGTMLFGHFQAEHEGETVYWENLRFADEAGALRLYIAERDGPTRRYSLATFVDGPLLYAAFEAPDNEQVRHLSYAVTVDGGLALTQEGVHAGTPRRLAWTLRRAAAP